ncbi:MAG: glutamine amidotransferase subunit PdxT [Bacillus thermozeamaize]|jgi:5'-phosphate synthase pdxT subunit|uniref:Pyridoxal 5'-phosphate synthase subunit PdxT n=1 Tax=Bacillus thermozeamaize TaxID=230954 RepID=A0A1Y3PI87_9BACI|nr:MAG: glutamine amidotransferase subunit PdxT [Bacillus thermozeamaize]
MLKPRIGVVAYQGAVPEHLRALESAGAEAVPVKWPRDLEGLHGVIIPGGESTVIGDAMQTWGLLDPLREWARNGGAVYGTCAGAILMATDIQNGKPNQPRLGLMPLTVYRNGFGRQVDSFEADFPVKGIGPEPFRAVFIRAPYFEVTDPEVEVLATLDDKVVAVRYGRHLATAFHPELTDDLRIHRLFMEMAIEGR